MPNFVYAYQDVNGCSNAVCDNTNVTTFLNVAPITNPSSSFNIYPNPNNGTFQIALEDKHTGAIDVKVFDQLGQQVYSKKYQSKSEKFEKSINLNNLANGNYNVVIQYGSTSKTQQFIIQK